MHKIVSLVIIMIVAFGISISSVSASGLQLVRDGETYYLSTTNDGNGTTTYTVVEDSTTSASRATGAAGLIEPIVPPTGYTENIGELINFILQIVIVIALLLVFFNLIMAGFQWITSGGDKGKIDAARQRIVSALVGILVLSAAYATAQLVAYVLGFDSFNEIFSTIKRINP